MSEEKEDCGFAAELQDAFDDFHVRMARYGVDVRIERVSMTRDNFRQLKHDLLSDQLYGLRFAGEPNVSPDVEAEFFGVEIQLGTVQA